MWGRPRPRPEAPTRYSFARSAKPKPKVREANFLKNFKKKLFARSAKTCTPRGPPGPAHGRPSAEGGVSRPKAESFFRRRRKNRKIKINQKNEFIFSLGRAEGSVRSPYETAAEGREICGREALRASPWLTLGRRPSHFFAEGEKIGQKSSIFGRKNDPKNRPILAGQAEGLARSPYETAAEGRESPYPGQFPAVLRPKGGVIFSRSEKIIFKNKIF